MRRIIAGSGVSMSEVNIKMVAKQAGVSISTVSNVINEARYVSAETKEKVLAAIKELNYEPNNIARSMKSNKTRLIGVIIPNINRVFVSPVLSGLQQEAERVGYNLLLCDSGGKPEKEKACLKMFAGNMVDGIVLDSVAPADDEEYFRSLFNVGSGKKRIPVVSMERDLTGYGIPSVFFANRIGGEIAAQKLVDSGARRIVFITTGSEIVTRRFDGHRAVLERNGIPFDERLLVNAEASPWGGYNAIKKLISDEVEFDGIQAGNDQIAIGALKALREHNIRVPEEVKIVGFDNIFASSIVDPPLTVVNNPKKELGNNTINLLSQYIDEPSEHLPMQVELPVTLVERESTLPPQKVEWELQNW